MKMFLCFKKVCLLLEFENTIVSLMYLSFSDPLTGRLGVWPPLVAAKRICCCCPAFGRLQEASEGCRACTEP